MTMPLSFSSYISWFLYNFNILLILGTVSFHHFLFNRCCCFRCHHLCCLRGCYICCPWFCCCCCLHWNPPHHRSTLILNEAYVPQHFLFNRTPVQRGRDKISGHMYPHKNVAHSWLENRDMWYAGFYTDMQWCAFFFFTFSEIIRIFINI